ncbi:hypothetical protein [Boudabousia liubingyangii]|uniref:hypothetical protein n=1 Tax=Boudabousia liubingyangii TaxID=1921764 RepID=UPI000F7B242B|nr:hypothetical protein [Boudabousia liubingyangii]
MEKYLVPETSPLAKTVPAAGENIVSPLWQLKVTTRCPAPKCESGAENGTNTLRDRKGRAKLPSQETLSPLELGRDVLVTVPIVMVGSGINCGASPIKEERNRILAISGKLRARKIRRIFECIISLPKF